MGCERRDTELQVAERIVEGGGRAGIDGIGNRPVQGATLYPRALEFFVRAIAHGHDEVRPGDHLVERAWMSVGEIQACALPGANREGMHSVRRMRAGALGVNVAHAVPQRGRELGTGRVPRAHEQDAVGGDRRTRCWHGLERRPRQPQVSAAPVSARREPLHESGILEDPKVMCEEVGTDPKISGQLGRGEVGQGEAIDYAEPMRVRERAVDGYPSLRRLGIN